jgi:hypothetical protein
LSLQCCFLFFCFLLSFLLLFQAPFQLTEIYKKNQSIWQLNLKLWHRIYHTHFSTHLWRSLELDPQRRLIARPPWKVGPNSQKVFPISLTHIWPNPNMLSPPQTFLSATIFANLYLGNSFMCIIPYNKNSSSVTTFRSSVFRKSIRNTLYVYVYKHLKDSLIS